MTRGSTSMTTPREVGMGVACSGGRYRLPWASVRQMSISAPTQGGTTIRGPTVLLSIGGWLAMEPTMRIITLKLKAMALLLRDGEFPRQEELAGMAGNGALYPAGQFRITNGIYLKPTSAGLDRVTIFLRDG